ncbi:auxin efflux carrier [Paraphysoderma sedebokerense]|nr:auxin efflux carrier [Paraphysoderma sedebokerense]
MEFSTIIWSSAKAILKIGVICAAGASLARRGIMDVRGMKMASKLVLELFFPCLMFSRMINAINPSNAPFLLVLAVTQIFYLTLGHIVGFSLLHFLKEKLPPNFRYSVIPAASYGNQSDLVLSIIFTVASQPIFSKNKDPISEGVAYVSIFMALFNVSMFSFGTRLIARDFKKKDKIQEPPENGAAEEHGDSNLIEVHELNPLDSEHQGSTQKATTNDHDNIRSRNSSASSPLSVDQPQSSERLPSSDIPITARCPPEFISRFFSKLSTKHSPTLRKFSRSPLFTILTSPPNLGIWIGLIVGLSPLKKLFIYDPENSTTEPVLLFLYDITVFFGAAAVPLSMTAFGGALTTVQSDLSILKRQKGLLTVLITLVIFRLILLPTIAISLVQGYVWWGFVPREEKMLRFVLMLEGCVPTAQLCILLTQLHSPTGESTEIATVMLAQYIFAIFSLIASLSVIFWLLT